MLASITPLGERGRRSRWPVTVVMFALGAAGAAVLLGGLLGALGSLLWPHGGHAQARLTALAAGLALALALDLLPAPVPGPRRQVNERWLDELRGWVYGLGFGGQLGLAVTTVVSSGATYAALLAALLAAGATSGAIILGVYGALRGLTPLAAAWVRRPDQLLALHRAMERGRAPARYLVAAGLAVLLVATVGLAL